MDEQAKIPAPLPGDKDTVEGRGRVVLSPDGYRAARPVGGELRQIRALI
jgi:hypothetical protein